VIAYDRRGFGRSPGPPATGIRDHVDDAAELLRALDAAPATVVGWSGGGVVAAGLTVEHPELVGSLVLEEGALHMARNPTTSSVLGTLRIEFARRVRRDNRRAARALFDWALAYRAGGTQFERWPPDWQEWSPRSTTWARSYPGRAALESIACPVTILDGTESGPVFGKVNRYLLKHIPDARLVEIEGAAHAIHYDRPAQFREAVAAPPLPPPRKASPGSRVRRRWRRQPHRGRSGRSRRRASSSWPRCSSSGPRRG
jgi:pimeloyl-ACP methyl ester carboxylesterase